MRDGIGDWPQNLMDELEITPEDDLDKLGDIGNIEVAMLLSSMTPREKESIRLRFEEEKSIKEISEVFGVSPERCRQIIHKALRKMRHPVARYILKNGVRAYIQERIEKSVAEIVAQKEAALEAAYQEKLDELSRNTISVVGNQDISKTAKAMGMTIEELGLSVRAYNCMKRAWCNTVADIVDKYPTYDEAKRIRNLGRKSLTEVSVVLKSMGVVWPKEEDRF